MYGLLFGVQMPIVCIQTPIIRKHTYVSMYGLLFGVQMPIMRLLFVYKRLSHVNIRM